ncbi:MULTISPECIES: hypothetical protein [Pseudomonas]|jgi:outer membrane murein-binding lipoprotein Lpp|nr:hypothetical protein [Pseudomonas aeruginosa]AON71096.1 hypothetical protein BG483_07965 [Pseudomonas aeruginosa]EIU3316564.1 hypothetical protein [Pseudomonas aeruginosa]EIU6857734.1 hypothetical protein [Pseudomonas aeruginosa]EIU6984309.1 hypothetical protein [Pseudomonas aeruginosa]EJM8826908.1 hypothetical protein [Pseudomonas aeruginosa]
MNMDVNQLIRAIDELASKVNALMAVSGGLAAQVYQAEGEQGLENARAKANTIARQLERPGVRLDKTVLNNIFDSAKR